MNMLEIRDLCAHEWGTAEIYFLKVSDGILRAYREKYPEHVVSVKPGDWVICGFDGLMYGKCEFVRFLAPALEVDNDVYRKEFRGVLDILDRLNAA